MKKSLIALAVAAGSIAAAQADTTTLYGSLGYSSVISQTNDIQPVDDNGNVISKAGKGIEKGWNGAWKGFKNNHWDIATSTAKLGVKGTEDLDNGLQAFFKFEFGAGEGLDSTKYAYLGLKGDFGAVTIGKQKSLFKTVTDTGLFNDVGIGYNMLNTLIEDSNDDDVKELYKKGGYAYPGTVSKAVSYVSPASGGVQFGASVIADNSNFGSLGADAWEVAAMYKQAGWDAGVVYSNVSAGMPKYENGEVKADKTNTQEFIGVNVGYSNDQFGVVGRAIHESSVATEYGIEGEYKTGPNTFRAGFGVYDPNSDFGDKNIYNAALGYQYNFSQRTYTWVEGQYTDYNNDDVDNGFKALVGIRHDF